MAVFELNQHQQRFYTVHLNVLRSQIYLIRFISIHAKNIFGKFQHIQTIYLCW